MEMQRKKKNPLTKDRVGGKNLWIFHKSWWGIWAVHTHKTKA